MGCGCQVGWVRRRFAILKPRLVNKKKLVLGKYLTHLEDRFDGLAKSHLGFSESWLHDDARSSFRTRFREDLYYSCLGEHTLRNEAPSCWWHLISPPSATREIEFLHTSNPVGCDRGYFISPVVPSLTPLFV